MLRKTAFEKPKANDVLKWSIMGSNMENKYSLLSLYHFDTTKALISIALKFAGITFTKAVSLEWTHWILLTKRFCRLQWIGYLYCERRTSIGRSFTKLLCGESGKTNRLEMVTNTNQCIRCKTLIPRCSRRWSNWWSQSIQACISTTHPRFTRHWKR